MRKKSERYIALEYNKAKDSYELWASSSDDPSWGLVIRCDCLECKDHPDQGKEYVHIAMLEELRKAVSLGYKLVRR